MNWVEKRDCRVIRKLWHFALLCSYASLKLHCHLQNYFNLYSIVGVGIRLILDLMPYRRKTE